MTFESTSGPGPMAGTEDRIKKRYNFHNEPKCRFVNAPTKTAPARKTPYTQKKSVQAHWAAPPV